MSTYRTSSGFADLDGSCEIDGRELKSYTSTILGKGEVHNTPGPPMNFTVQWPNADPPRRYVIMASPEPDGFRGDANDGGGEQIEEPWAATAITARPVVAGQGV